MPANDKSTQDYFGHAIILSDTHINLSLVKVRSSTQNVPSGKGILLVPRGVL